MDIKALWLILLTLLSACHKETREQKAADDARDVAMVEQMSREPFVPIVPKPITNVDRARFGLDHRGCMFTAKGDKAPIFVAGPDEGFMDIDGNLGRYAAKVSSAELPGHAHSAYVGLDNWVDIVRQPDAGTNGTDVHWPARLMVHDAQERVAFMIDGMMNCTEG